MSIHRFISFLLLSSFSAFLGHNLIPHHHHAEVLHHPLSNCPVEHEDSHEHDHDHAHDAGEHPAHCHAFNDVVFQKHSTPTIRPWTTSIQTIMVPGQVILPVEVQGRSPYEHVVLKLPCKSAITLGSRDLRAPPMFA